MDPTLSKKQGLVSCSSPSEDDILKYAIQLEFSDTNNITEYKGAGHYTSGIQRPWHLVALH
jgi:hypothetical protein